MILHKYIRLFNTIKFLKPVQVYYRIYYFSRKKIRSTCGQKLNLSLSSSAKRLKIEESIHIADCYSLNHAFKFLNLEKKFENKIDWNYSLYGKLWTYNLSYFDYLSQSNVEESLLLINSFIEELADVKDGLEPFPISLRGINWIKFFTYYKIENKIINDSLYAQYQILLDNLEYHLLGNHLLENAFSLLFAAYYFEDEVFYKKAKKLLLVELEEQILNDGAHFELTPMYHQIILFRLLDSINLVENNEWKDKELLVFLKEKSELMLSWLKEVTYRDGSIPLLNDSTNGIAPTSRQLFSYAKRLNIRRKNISLSQSGYRKITKNNYESIIDVGHIGADYIPGHVHSDIFNFELKILGRAFIVDMGLSTYETCLRRMLERSTASHNTVEVNSENQSDVWGGFRVGKRANIVNLEEKENYFKATHDGYKKDNIYHTRTWNFYDKKLIITDSLNKNIQAISRLHFHPSITKEEIERRVKFKSLSSIIKGYKYAPEFNIYREALVLEIVFINKLEVFISL